MLTYGGLWERVTDFEELYLAYRRARRGKRNSAEMAGFAYDLEAQLLRLRRELRGETYALSPYRSFEILDPKRRTIYAAAFRDRVVHHALYAAIEPIFDVRMIEDSYACRVGKGTHAALDALDRHWLAAQVAWGQPWVAQLDIHRYFYSIDHGILADMMCCRLREAPLIRLVRKIVSSLSTGEAAGIGIPIGNLTSQLFANVYLDALDQYARRELKIPHYLRYMDDVAIFAESKTVASEWLGALGEYAEDRLHLRLNERRTVVMPERCGVSWLGWRMLAPGQRRLSRRMVVRSARRLREVSEALASGEMTPEEVQQRLASWIGHVKHGNTWRLRESLLNSVEWRLV